MNLHELGEKAVCAKYELQKLTEERKNEALCHVANVLVEDAAYILEENEKDLQAAKENGMHEGLIDRLRLTKERIEGIAEGLRQIVELPDPIGEVLEESVRPNGLSISKVRVPLGVIGIIYESRPNVTADAFGLCFKTGNAVSLFSSSSNL